MKKVKLILIFCTVIIFNSCEEKEEKSCANLPDLIVSNELYNKYGDKYCELVSSSLKRDKKSIVELSKLEINETELISSHAEVLMQVVDNIGQDLFLNCIGKIDKRESFKLNFYFENGFRNSRIKDFKGKTFSETFPNLQNFISNKL